MGRTTPLSNIHLLQDEALAIGFMRGFRTQEIQGTTTLDCRFGFPDSEGAVRATMDASVSAHVRDPAQERHARAFKVLNYYNSLDVRLAAEGLEPSEKPPIYIKATEYLQNNRLPQGASTKSFDLLPYLGAAEKDLIHNGAPMNSMHAEALRVFLGGLSVRERQRSGYEALGEEFGPDV